jgi:ribosomal protein S6
MQNKEITAKETEIYEVGYHIMPSVPEEKLPLEVSAILSAIVSKNGGVIISSDAPAKIELAYTMAKKVGATRHKCDEAYFGWFKFEMSPDNINALKAFLDAQDNVLRFLLIKTVRENTLVGAKLLAAEMTASDPKEEVKAEGKAVKSPVSEAELDKTIDELVKA